MWTEKENSQTVADLGGGAKGGLRPPPQGFDPLPTQRVPPLVPFQKSIFGRPTLKFFQRRLWCQFILILRGSARQKNAFFLSKFSKKCPKTAFLTCFFKKIACGAENLAKTGSFYCFGRAQKINLFDLKKRSTKFFASLPPPAPGSAPAAKETLLQAFFF